MPRRQKLSPVEVLILMAILGILFSIIMPNIERAKRQAQRARRAPVVERTMGEGQLNTIEVSELSRPAERHSPMQWVGVLLGLAPVIFAVVVIFTIFSRLRRQMSRRA
jgi:uncharacterized membrane protein